MPPNSSPTFTPHTPTSLVQLLIYKPCSLFSFLLLRLILFKKRKKFIIKTTLVLAPLHYALPLFLLLLTPPSPPTNHAPPTHPTPPTPLTPPTRLIPLTPLHGT